MKKIFIFCNIVVLFCLPYVVLGQGTYDVDPNVEDLQQQEQDDQPSPATIIAPAKVVDDTTKTIRIKLVSELILDPEAIENELADRAIIVPEGEAVVAIFTTNGAALVHQLVLPGSAAMDNHIYSCDDDGLLTPVELTSEGYLLGGIFRQASQGCDIMIVTQFIT
jgi:hypothetical protein